MLRSNLLNLTRFKMADQCFSDCCGLRRDATSNPDIHLDEIRRLDAIDIDSVAMIQNRKMRTESCAVHDLPQVWHRNLAQRHTLNGLPTQTQNTHAQGMLSGF